MSGRIGVITEVEKREATVVHITLIHHYSSLFHHLMGFVATLKNETSVRKVKLGAEDRDFVSYSGPNDKTSEKSKIACQDSPPEPRTEDGHTEKNYFSRNINSLQTTMPESRFFAW